MIIIEMYGSLRLFKPNITITRNLNKSRTNLLYIIRLRPFSHLSPRNRLLNSNYSVNVVHLKCTNVRNSSILAAISEKSHVLFTKLSESYPVHVAQDLLVNFHDTTGLPWWATVVVSTCLLRTCITLPLGAYQQSVVAKLENITDEMRNIEEELKAETALAIKKFNWSKKEAFVVYRRSLKKQWNKLVIRDNCHPFKTTILMWIQIPTWICLSAAIRNLVYMLPNLDIQAQIIFAELQVGGFAWIPNLTIPDNSYIFPVALGLINLLIIEIQLASRLQEQKKVQKYLTNFFRVLTIALVPVACTVPSCLCLYWVSSSTCGLIQNLILLSPAIRNLCRIPVTKKNVPQPYQLVWKKLKQKFTFSLS